MLFGKIFGKKKDEAGAWCPICRTPRLHASAVGFSWKCRECGSRIPNRTLKRLIVRRVEEMAWQTGPDERPD